MLTKPEKEFAGVVFSLALSLALWGCIGTINSPSSTKGTAPVFTLQPAGQSDTVGQTATFSVMVTGTAPLKNNANISGANSASYTTPATVLVFAATTNSVAVFGLLP